MSLLCVASVLGERADTQIIALVVQPVQVPVVNQRNRARRKTKDKTMHSRAVCHDSIVRILPSISLDVPLVFIETLKISIINQGNKALSQLNCPRFPSLRRDTCRDYRMCFASENSLNRPLDNKAWLYVRRRR